MAVTVTLLVCILLSLVEVKSETAPYVMFMGETLPNHAYVDLNLVGSNDSVQCHTDLHTCCNGTQGPYRGDWFPPNSQERLPFRSDAGDIYEYRKEMCVELRRRYDGNVSGIYRCDIQTRKCHTDGNRQSVYVGLYASGGA